MLLLLLLLLGISSCIISNVSVKANTRCRYFMASDERPSCMDADALRYTSCIQAFIEEDDDDDGEEEDDEEDEEDDG